MNFKQISYYNPIILIVFLLFFNSSLAQKTRPKIGLVLSGGGAKGIAHIGVLKELEKIGVKPDYIVGTSFGALVAGFYAIGYSPEQMEEIIINNDWDYLINDVIERKNVLIGESDKNKKAILSLPLDGITPGISSGVFKGQNILTFFEITCKSYNRPLDFDSLEIPFRCIATNIETGEEKVFDKGLLPRVMRASMSIPSVFQPFEVDGELYVDGGLVNNFPTDVVKEMGADIIIGVDVGAVLYKKEEIKTIFQILDQSSSFYNARISKKNKELCDIYIRPNIDGISAMGFSQVGEIIERGSQSIITNLSMIDSVLEKASYNPKEIINKEISDSLSINSILVKFNKKNPSRNRSMGNLVRGKLNLKPPLTISNEGLSDRVNQVYGSKFFEEVSVGFEPVDTSYAMTITVKEKTENNFMIGARFDQTYGVNILLRAEFRNLLFYGSLLELKTIIGQSPHVGYRYTTERGSYIGYGTSFTYDFLDTYTYEDDKISSTYAFQRTMMDFFIHSHLGNFNRIIAGGEISFFSLTTNQSFADINDMDHFYYSAFLAYVIDTWDDAYFPSSGFKAKFRGDLIGAENNTVYTHGWGRATYVFDVHKKFKMIGEVFVGLASIGTDTTVYRFEFGGMENNRIDWYSSFPGLRFMEHGGNNVWITKISPRYEFWKNHFLTFTFAYGAYDEETFVAFTKPSHFYSGISLKYSFNSMFGPLEISTDYSFQSYRNHFFISLGYWF